MPDNRESQAEQLQLPSFEPITILRDVLRRWYLIVAAAILAGMAAYVVSGVRYKPVYQTNTTFVVSARGSSTTVYQNLTAATNLASVFSEVLNSSLLRSAVLDELGMSGFDGTISAAAVPETNLLTLRVTASDPRTAFLVTRSVIDNHHIVSYQVLGDTVLDVLQSPKVPTAPINSPGELANAKKAAVLAAAAVCVLLGALSALRDTVRSQQEAEQKLDCRLLGCVRHERKYKTPAAMLRRKKTSILITSPSTSFLFAETIRKLRRRIEQQMPAGGKVLMFTSVAENEGKSTLAVNIALAMAQKGKRVLLIDADLRKPACHKILEYSWRGPGTAEVALGKAALEDAVLPMKDSSLSLLLAHRGAASSTDLSGSDGMAALIARARELYDFVVIDTPPMSAAPDSECIMELADATLLVVQQNVVTANAINSACAALRSARAKLLGCVLNNAYGGSDGGHSYGYGYGYGRYGKYGKYGAYGAYAAKTHGESGVETTK